MSDEERGRSLSQAMFGFLADSKPARVVSELRRGYFYPLDVRRALDRHAGPPYVLACARRARRDLDSARNAQRKRALRAIELETIRSLARPP